MRTPNAESSVQFTDDTVPCSTVRTILSFQEKSPYKLRGGFPSHAALTYDTHRLPNRQGFGPRSWVTMFRRVAQRAARVALPLGAAALAGSFVGASGEDHIEPPKYSWANGPFSTFDAQA